MQTMTDTRLGSTADPGWEPGPRLPALQPGALHVWIADLATVSTDLVGVLSAAEQTRASRFLDRPKGSLWARSRGVLRELLGRYLLQDPGELRFVVDAGGKPALDGHAHESRASPSVARDVPKHYFNLSHSGRWGLYAVTSVAEVGIDIEVARSPAAQAGATRRAFGIAQAERLRRPDVEKHEREFLRLWVRREADLKRRGRSIAEAGRRGTCSRGWVEDLEVGSGRAAAVAVSGPCSEVCCWEYR